MARHVFFSFHYERDIWRASRVRNSWVTKPDRQSAGFWDAASWEAVKNKGEDAINKWIDAQLYGTSVTAVLIGNETWNRKYVITEIVKSFNKGNGLLGIYIHNMKDNNGFTDYKGNNPFDYIYEVIDGTKCYLSEYFPVYDWVYNDGYNNIADWIEKAARSEGK